MESSQPFSNFYVIIENEILDSISRPHDRPAAAGTRALGLCALVVRHSLRAPPSPHAGLGVFCCCIVHMFVWLHDLLVLVALVTCFVSCDVPQHSRKHSLSAKSSCTKTRSSGTFSAFMFISSYSRLLFILYNV